jgi:Cof subfamily protein (haloacid dehalogenase superfamily)
LLDSTARLPAPPALIVVDVDGTLLTSTHAISPTTVAEVRRVRASGVDVLPASSRGPRAMLPVLRALGLPAAFVGSQGAFTGCYDARGVLRPTRRHPALADAVRPVVAAAVAGGLAVSWFAVDRWLVSHVDETIEREARVVHDTPEVADLLDQDDGPDKLMIIARYVDDLPALRALARGLPPGLTARISNPTYLEITRSGVDKASAVREYCAHRGIAAGSVVAFGDGPNDLGLLAFAGTSVAPANARPEVAAAATWITRSNDDDGVAWALSVLVPGSDGQDPS